ncbi:MAG TPA: hypothetical protein VKT77_01950, partial [Chthonomonadaceae bacterium]|nr:hypothetical protein [Chthonomonadaceae bacterium]
VQGGVPLMPDPPARIAALAAHRRLAETPEVILIADELRTAVAIAASLTWARVAGIAVEREAGEAATPAVPTVTGVAGVLRAATDDVLVLVDATRGVVLVDPDPVYLAQYTAEHDRVAPKNRIYLDEQHLPAQTLDGRTITVIADASAGIEGALRSGADALYYAPPVVFGPDDLRRHLRDILTIGAGKPLFVPYNPSAPLQPLLEAATHADLTLIVSPTHGAVLPDREDVRRLVQESEAIESECAKHDIICALPRVATEVDLRVAEAAFDDALETQLEGLAAAGVTRLVASGDWGLDQLSELADLCAAASAFLMPVVATVGAGGIPAQFEQVLRYLLGSGVTMLLVDPVNAAAAKTAMRSLSNTECKSALALYLNW